MTRAASLARALGVRRGSIVALVGGGGKTSAVLALAAELERAGQRVLATTTTKVGPTLAAAMPVVLWAGSSDHGVVARELEARGSVFVAGGRGSDGKYLGIDPAAPAALLAEVGADVVVVEADGARQRSLKAPGEHEPVLPVGADIICPMAGLDVLGLPLDPESVHRPELVRGISPGARVTPELLARVVTSERGGLKGAPESAAIRPILNKMLATSSETAAATARLILGMCPERIDRVILAEIRDGSFSVLTHARLTRASL